MKLDTARAEALFASSAGTGATLTRGEIDRLIADAVRDRGGVRGCVAVLATRYGDGPETAVPRMRWALRIVRDTYPIRSPARPAR
jgi:hypothetical protein